MERSITLVEERRLPGSSQDPDWRARQWLGYLDLHGLDQPRAMEALRQRIHLLQTGSVKMGSMPLPPEVAGLRQNESGIVSLPASYLPGHLKIVTGRGAGSLVAPPRGTDDNSKGQKPTSVLRSNVLNFLRVHKFDFVETPVDGVGCFEVRIGSGQKLW